MSASTAESSVVSRLDEDPSARLAFSDRVHGNVSLLVGGGEAVENRSRLPGLVGCAPDQAVFMEQVHGSRVATVGYPEAGRGLRQHGDAIADADALVTHATDLALVVLVADCVPVLLVDPGRGVAVAHAGRRGVAEEVIPATVAALTPAPGRVVGVLGPAIGGCCYEVPQELVEQVGRVTPAARTRTRAGAPGLDLPAAAAEQLSRAGVGTIVRTGGCTRCHADRWFSHRGDEPARRGRQAGVVCRRSAVPAASRLPRNEPGVA